MLDLLANLVRYRSGRLEPSYAYLMAKLRRSKDAVHRALAALREHEFLDWLRRFEPVEVVDDGPGPRVRQVSNAYRLSLLAHAAQLLGHWLTSPLLPDDVAQEREDRAAWLAGHKSRPASVRATARGSRGRPAGAGARQPRSRRRGSGSS